MERKGERLIMEESKISPRDSRNSSLELEIHGDLEPDSDFHSVFQGWPKFLLPDGLFAFIVELRKAPNAPDDFRHDDIAVF